MKKRIFYIFVILVFTCISLLCQPTTKIYYTRSDNTFRRVYSSDLDGSNETYFTVESGYKPKAIAVDWNNTPVQLFIALSPTGSGAGKIIRCNTDGTSPVDVVPTTNGSVYDIELNVGAKELYWIEDSYYDDYIYHGIMYGTNNSPVEIYHSTTDNVTLWGLGYNVGDNTLWFTLRGSNNSNSYVKKMLTNGTGLADVKNPVNNPHDIEYYNGNYYLLTGEGIAKIEGVTEAYSVIQASEQSGDGISIDSYNHKIYWVDYISNVVKNCNLDGSSVTTVSLVSHGLLQKIDTDYNAAALPVELISFTATFVNNTVKLHWRTATEVDNYGFEIERSSSRQVGTTPRHGWEKVGFVEGHGNSASPKEYSFTDDLTNTGFTGKIKYRLKQIDTDGAFEYSDAIEMEIAAPEKFTLSQNHPNPFGKSSAAGNSFTTIKYSVPNVGSANFASSANVRLKVYDALGREVATLVNKEQTPGNYQVEFDAGNLSSGVYIYRLSAGKFTAAKKMMIIR